jgi:hypothetical protein
MAAYNKVFFHGTGTGIGTMALALDTAGIPFTAKAVANGGWAEAVANLRRESGIRHSIIYRDPNPGGAPDDHPDYNLPPADAALKHWRLVVSSLPSEVIANKDIIWIEPVNEIDTQTRAEWLGRFCFAIGELAMDDGFNVLLSGFNAGQPGEDQWSLYFRDFLTLCADNPNRVGVSLHEGKLGVPVDTDINDERINPWLIGRWQFLHDWCDAMGIARPTIFISEWSWAYNNMPSSEIAMRDIVALSESIAMHSNIRGVCLWNLDSDPNWGQLPGKLASLIDDVTQFTLDKRYPDPPDNKPPAECAFIYPVLEYDKWVDSNPYGTLYTNSSTGNQSYHTGADLNKNDPVHDSDGDQPVMAVSDGVVTCAGHYPVWGSIVVIKHCDGTVYSRYGHLYNLRVHVGDVVLAGSILGTVGRDELDGPYHLHFDISTTDALLVNPADWPGMDLARVARDYVDPIKFIEDRSSNGVPMPKRIKHTIHLLPQDTSIDELVATVKKLHATRTAFTYSHDVAHAVMYAGNGDSVVVLWNPERWDMDVVEYFENMGVRTEVRYFSAISVPPPVTPPSPTLIDMAKYFLPPNQLNKGYIVNISNNWGQGNERTQLQRGANGHSLLTKNQQYEKRVIGTEFIDLVLDTSPGDGEYYTSSGHWIPRNWKPGAIYESGAKAISYFRQSDCSRIDGKTYTQPPTKLVFAKHYDMWTSPLGLVFQDVARLEWHVGSVVDETYWFADGLGLVRWLKYDGRESNAFEIISPGNQDDNVPNIIHCAGV